MDENKDPKQAKTKMVGRLSKAKPWESDMSDSGRSTRKPSGPAPSARRPRPRSAPWRSEGKKEKAAAPPPVELEDDDISLGEASLGEDAIPPPPPPAVNKKPVAPAPSSISSSSSKPPKKPDNHHHKNNNNNKTSSNKRIMVKEALPPKPPKPVGVAVPQEKTAEQIVEENAELLAIDFDRDGDALREAIGEDILAMWKDQGLYQDMPDLRNEMLKGIVDTKFEALREEQAQVLAKKELASMPKVMSDSASERMTMIIEEEEEESSEEEPEEEEEEPEPEMEEEAEASDGEDYAMSAIRATKSPVLRALAHSANLDNHIGSLTKEEQIAIRAFQVKEELQSKLNDMDTSYHKCVEATGRLGELTEKEQEISIRDYQAFNRFKLHHALQQRVSVVFTEDHHVVTGEEEEDEEEEEVVKDKGMDASTASLPALSACGKNEMDVSTASLPTVPSEGNKDPSSMRRVREDLTTSFSAFDKLLECKSPSQDEHDDDEYEEYEIEEVEDSHEIEEEEVEEINKEEETKKMRSIVADMDRKLGLVPGHTTSDDEESFMEYTVRDEIEEFTVNEVDIDELSASRERAMTPTAEVDIDELSEQRQKEEVEKDKTKQGSSAIPRIIRPQGKRPLNRTQSTESSYVEMTVADETRKDGFQKQASMMSLGGNFPTINVNNALDDDEMTQLTMDHTLEGANSTTQDHRLADAYLNKSTEKPLKSLSPPRKCGLGSSSQNTDPTRETVPMDESSYSQHDTGRSVDNSRDSSQAMAKSVAKILRVDMWSPKAKKVEKGMEKLAVAASHGFCQRSNINRLGGVIAIVRAMQSHPNNLQIQRSACTALAHLSVDEDSQEAIAEVGGMGAIVAAMQSHPNDDQVQESATLALANTTNPRGGGANGGGVSDSDEEEDDAESSGPGVVQALVTAMNTHPNNANVQAKAFISLANLCLDNQERLQELSESGGLTSMTMALQKPWTNKMEQHEAISTLSILLRSLAELGTSC